MFLDPYGMQVEWSTIEAIASTKAIDLWLLFPLGIGVNRLLKRSGSLPAGWKRRLDILLGTEDWHDHFYPAAPTLSLFPNIDPIREKVDATSVGKYFVGRLRTVFEDVVEDPPVLCNKSGCPLYLLCFAVGNKKGAPIAIRMASSIMSKLGKHGLESRFIS